MPEFTKEELNLIFLYDPGNLRGLIYELRSMMDVLMPDEKELRNLAQRTIDKLGKLSKAEYKTLCESWTPEYGLLHFDLGVDQDLMNTKNETED